MVKNTFFERNDQKNWRGDCIFASYEMTNDKLHISN